MKFATISPSFYDLCADEPEMLFREGGRPHLLVLSLQYKGRTCRFAIPFRSNIPATAPQDQYYSLPPRSTTRPGNHHGLHYIKMFPIDVKYQEKFNVTEKSSYALYQRIIDANKKTIVDDCQRYLNNYAAGNHPRYSVDIDKILAHLDSEATHED